MTMTNAQVALIAAASITARSGEDSRIGGDFYEGKLRNLVLNRAKAFEEYLDGSPRPEDDNPKENNRG